MLGAIIGDIVGSRFEWNNCKSKDFEFLTFKCFPTDDSVMTLALAQAILVSKPDYSDLSKNAVECMQAVGRKYPDCGYGGAFYEWMFSDNPKPYNSFGNGAAMRVSAAGFAANSLEEAKELSKKITEVTHNHPEGIKGAEATVVAIYMARTGSNILEIRDYIDKNYYPMNFTLDEIRDSYEFNETCQDTVPQALMAFFESTGFEDAIRNAISIGGDSDTLAAICGSVAEAYYGIPSEIRKHALTFLDKELLQLLVLFENKYPPVMEKRHDDKSIAVKRNKDRKVTTGERAEMIQSALETAEQELKDSIPDNEETTSQKLFTHLFEACNILRGPINQDEYKSYVTPILFFKRISDVYDEETQEALESSGGDVEFAAFPENHSFVIPKECHWNDVRSTSQNVGKAIVDAMTAIERANPDTLRGVFSSFDDANWTDKNKLTDERLKDLIEHMSRIKVGNKNYSADVMGDAYEFLIKKFADLSKKSAGEFYTPRAVVKLLVKILDPKPGETVYDPACGTGGMLIEAINHINNKQMTYGRIYGQEKNLSTSAISRMNLFLHGARDFQVVQGDTLRAPQFLERGKLRKFDCVIANPPFSLDNWGSLQFESDIYGRNKWGTPTDSIGDYAWIQHMFTSMNEKNGRCAVVLPQGVLYRVNREYKIRKNMIESHKVDCIINLVENLFYGASIPTCIVILSNSKIVEDKNSIFMIDASNIFTPERAQNYLYPEDIKKIYKLYQDGKDVEGISKNISIEEIRDKDYTLSVNRYIHKKKEEVMSYIDACRLFEEAMDKAVQHAANAKKMLEESGYINE
ncbi:N-6 DNA methylase [Clostridioides difficile]|nr:N-6 DNA methylase [Clostridioides difficile]